MIYIIVIIFQFLCTSVCYAEWHTEVVDDDNILTWTSIELDNYYNSHIAYVKSESILKYAAWNGSYWQKEVAVPYYSGGMYVRIYCPSLALDCLGNPHISFAHVYSYAPHFRYTHKEGGVWDTVTFDFSPTYLCFSSLDIDSSGYPRIAHSFWYDLGFLSWDGSSWQNEIIDTDTIGGNWNIPSMELDALGHAHIAYFSHSENDLKYAYYDGSVWITDSVIDSSGVENMQPSLCLDSSGFPHIAYLISGSLKYAYSDGAEWHVETVVSSGINYYPSLDLDSSDLPYISYYDFSNRDLKFVYKIGSEWQFETVDEIGDVGSYSSMVLDPAGGAHISYIDVTNASLKYAYNYTTGTEDNNRIEIANYNLLPIRPNPSSGTITIEYFAPVSTCVDLSIYNITGRLVWHSLLPNASSDQNSLSISSLDTGVYLCRMAVSDFSQVERFTIINNQ